ncbi:MAG TPA: S53 family peptidase, partial [bacterium]|nr:S53 family peptidase [bacterium]
MNKFHFQFPRFFLLIFPLLLALGTQAFAKQQLYGHIPRAVTTSPKIGSLPDNTLVHFSLDLPWRDPEGLDVLLRELYDPHNPLYRKFLSPDQFTMRFGPTQADYQAVIAFAKANGLQVESTYPNRLMVDVAGTVADIRRVLHVNLHQYSHPEGGTFYAPDAEPSLDLDIPLQHVTGLDNFARPKMKLHKFPQKTGGLSSNLVQKVGSKPVSGVGLYIGKDFRDAYVPDVPASIKGAGQTVALIEFDGFYAPDTAAYETAATITAPVPITVLVNGFNGTPVNAGDTDEVSLDIEMVISMAPDAQVEVLEVNPNANADTSFNGMLQKLVQSPLCGQISCSWGGFGNNTSKSLLNQLAAQGQAYLEASGDNGAFVAGSPVSNVADDPSLTLSDYETLVGGTILTTNPPTTPTPGSPITYVSETTWNDHVGASGGGIASWPTPVHPSFTPMPIPTYQVPIPMTSNSGSTLWRNIPDVACVAATIYLVAENLGYKGPIWGTSAASPLWAAYWALANQEAANMGKGHIGNPNPPLYTLALSPTPYANDFHDINDGSNNNWTFNGPYTVTAGYDLATGWGSPKGQNLITDLVAADTHPCG